jgi:hypothetical protein
MDYSPEPYFVLKKGKNPLYLLLTNPGSGMEFQHISRRDEIDYAEFEGKLAEVYTSENFKNGKGSKIAYRRLMKSMDFAEYLGFDSLVNVETFPFHSERLNKHIALNVIEKSPTLKSYQTALKNFLIDKPVLIVSACSSKESISIKSLSTSEWLMYQCGLAGINVDFIEITPLTSRNKKTTSAMFSYKNKHIVLMMGSNNLPSLRKQN